MIELKNVSKTLAGKPVLRNVSLTVPRGETLVIVGASGAGKSVTLKHMIGLLRPDSGEVHIDGRAVHTAHGAALAEIRQQFGVLFQSGALINWMNVFENIALPLYEKTDLSEAEIKQRVQEKLALVGLEGAEKKMPSELSGGMRKRAGLARALVTAPAIVLYDEPTSGLDPILSRSIDAMIRELKVKLQTTGVVVTHDLHSAFNVGDQIAMLYEGEIVEKGAPEVFFKSQHPFVKEFIASHFSTKYNAAMGEQ